MFFQDGIIGYFEMTPVSLLGSLCQSPQYCLNQSQPYLEWFSSFDRKQGLEIKSSGLNVLIAIGVPLISGAFNGYSQTI